MQSSGLHATDTPTVVFPVQNVLPGWQAQSRNRRSAAFQSLAMLAGIGANHFDVHEWHAGIPRDLLPFAPSQFNRIARIGRDADA